MTRHQTTNPTVVGRRLCTSPYHEGPRWRSQTDFPATRRGDGRPHLGSYCHACQRIYHGIYRERARVRRAQARLVADRLRASIGEPGRPKRPPERLPVGPLRAWLARKVQAYGPTNVAASSGVSARTVHRILHERGKAFVLADTVDRFMTAFQENAGDLYPELWER